MMRDLTASDSFLEPPEPQLWLRPSVGTPQFVSSAARWLTAGLVHNRSAHDYRFAVLLAVFAFNLFGDGLRDLLDPRAWNRGE